MFKLEECVLKNKSKYEILVDRYLKIIENVLFNKVDIDEEFL